MKFVISHQRQKLNISCSICVHSLPFYAPAPNSLCPCMVFMSLALSLGALNLLLYLTTIVGRYSTWYTSQSASAQGWLQWLILFLKLQSTLETPCGVKIFPLYNCNILAFLISWHPAAIILSATICIHFCTVYCYSLISLLPSFPIFSWCTYELIFRFASNRCLRFMGM